MSGPSSEEWMLLFVTALVVVFLVFCSVRRLWNYPLKHGPGFFLGVEVAPGFYAGEGVRWLKRYRTILLMQYLIEAVVLAAILVSGRWTLLPWWAGGTGVFATAVFLGFTAYTRATLGANPPVRTSAVVSLETRRLGDYISWPLEVLMAAIIVLCWALLLTHGNAHVQWNSPVVMTYLLVGLFSFKIGVVRNSSPLASERAEEHYRWAEAQRRYWLRQVDCLRWFFIVILAGYVLQHGWPAANEIVGVRWLAIGLALAVWLVLVRILIRGSGSLASMGRDLRPAGSWSGPFRRATLVMPGISPWLFGAWFGGLVLLIVLFRQ